VSSIRNAARLGKPAVARGFARGFGLGCGSAIAFLFVAGLLAHPAFGAKADKPQGKVDLSLVPGVVIDHLAASSGTYVGSPSIAILANGDYLATHDNFGPKSNEHVAATTRVFGSSDKGKTWTHLTDINPAFWSTVFSHNGAAYLIGTTHHHGNFVIRRSTDGGKTWTTPADKDSGLLLAGEYHCAPVPVVVHDGRIWRAVEDAGGGTAWGVRYRAMMMSAPVDADLLKADSWTHSNYLARDEKWLGGTFGAWLEGNAVVGPDRHMLDVLRVEVPALPEKAAIVRISDDGKSATFDPTTGFVDFPGGAKKFAIRFDPKSKLYWALSNPSIGQPAATKPASVRNSLALISSPDLKQWTTHCIILHHADITHHAFQYVDWLFDGDDIIVASRTAFDDGLGGAHRAHDANFLTFHRLANFRDLTMKDSAPMD
jgi:hypothetical protein